MAQGALMSLSKFYKANSDFKPAVVLEEVRYAKEPVWESIIKGNDTEPAAESSDTIPQPHLDQQEDAPLSESLPDIEKEEGKTEDDLAADITPPPPQELPPTPSIDINEIREESFNSGIAVGRKQAEEDFENGVQTLLCICNELDRLRETILQNSIGEMRELVLAIAEKIIRHSVEEQSETITATIIEAIHLAVKSDEFQIQLNPEDLACIEEKKSEIIDKISGLDNVVLKPDATLERGGCMIESTSCTIDASMASQLKVIRNSLMASEQLPENIPS